MTQDAPRAEGIPSPGDMIAGRYRVDEQIGKGGMGVVFRATQLPLGRAVAVKIILPNQAQQGEMQARFEREARVTSPRLRVSRRLRRRLLGLGLRAPGALVQPA